MNWTFARQVGVPRWFIRYGTLQFNKRVLKRDSALRLPTGVKITLPRHSGNATEIYVTNANTDWGAEAIFARFADSGRDFLDIGSHIGYYAAYLAPLTRKVYAFEPCPRNLPYLYENARRATNIEVVEMAVSYRDGEANFFSGGGTAVGSLEDVGGETVRVTVTTTDTFLQSRGDIDPCLIKTDIEGHDLAALQGMQTTASKFQPLILTECGLSEDLAGLCANWSYKIYGTIRDRKSLKTQFRELTAKDANRCWHKMLFLAPPSLQPAFAELARG